LFRSQKGTPERSYSSQTIITELSGISGGLVGLVQIARPTSFIKQLKTKNTTGEIRKILRFPTWNKVIHVFIQTTDFHTPNLNTPSFLSVTIHSLEQKWLNCIFSMFIDDVSNNNLTVFSFPSIPLILLLKTLMFLLHISNKRADKI
jgi:hypothetical protein